MLRVITKNKWGEAPKRLVDPNPLVSPRKIITNNVDEFGVAPFGDFQKQGNPHIVQVMHDHFSIETYGDNWGSPMTYEPPHFSMSGY